MAVCTITDAEFIEIMNGVAKQEKGALTPIIRVASLDAKLAEFQLDSLSALMFYVWLSEMFGIPDNEETLAAINGESTGREIFDFVKQYQTQCYDFEEVRKVLKI